MSPTGDNNPQNGHSTYPCHNMVERVLCSGMGFVQWIWCVVAMVCSAMVCSGYGV